MAPVAGPSTASSVVKSNSSRTASRSKTNKRIDQERILDRLLAAFLDGRDAASTSSHSTISAAQKSRAIQAIEKDSWSPADDDEVAAALHGLSLKHSIHLDYELATALQRCYSQLLVSCERSVRFIEQVREAEKRRGAANARSVPDPLVRPDNVSDAVRFLLRLSKPADVTARTAANLMLNATHYSRAQYLTPEQRKQAERREWLNILLDEPLQGDAWIDDGMDQDNSDLSDWSLDSDDEQKLSKDQGYDSDKEVRKRRDRLTAIAASIRPSASSTHDFHQRELWSQGRQSRFDTLQEAGEKSLTRSAGQTTGSARDLTEADVVRESISALIGFSSLLFTQHSFAHICVTNTHKEHSSVLNGLTEQMEAIATLASTFSSLHGFVATTVSQSIHAVDALTRTPAVEAFAEQLQTLLERLRSRLSELDADISVASMPSHPAAIHTQRYATLTQLLEVVHREAASVLLLATLLYEMGFTSRPGTDTDAPAVPRAFSDRALIDGLQALLAFVHQQDEVAHRDIVLADLSTCLLAACRPAWKSVCHLLQRGLSFAIRRDHDPLFDDRLVQHMVRHDTSLSTSDSTFWMSGYVMNRASSDMLTDDIVDGSYSPPAFLQSIMQDVLTTAKGVGLLRSLGIDALGEVQPNADLDRILGLSHATASGAFDPFQGHGEREEDNVGGKSIGTSRLTPDNARMKLRQLLFSQDAPATVQGEDPSQPFEDILPQTPLSRPDTEPLWQVAPARPSQHISQRLLEPMLGRLLQEHLSPISAIVRKRLIQVLSVPVTEGGYALQTHLRACHGLYFMQQGAEMASWLQTLFLDLDRRNGTVRATNHHRLHSGFVDALEAHQRSSAVEAWIDVNLVRFFAGDDEESAAAIRQRTRIRRLADIQVEYEVPWPLTFVFPLGCMRFYQSVLTTLLQARYAQWKLSSTLKLAKPETMHMRKFWSLRRQAQWLVRTLIEFLQNDVVLQDSQRLCSALEGVDSIDSAIQIHMEALDRMEMLCFHRAEQAKVKELFSAAWRIGAEVVNNYERFIGTSNHEEDRLARRKRRERRKKRRDKAKRDGAPLGAIAEEEEEEEDEEEDEEGEGQEQDDKVPEGDADVRDYNQRGRFDGEEAVAAHSQAFDSTSVDASMSADISSSWIESESNKRQRFRIECERQRKALDRLVEELKVNVDDQIGRIAAKAAVQAHDATQADRALQEHDYARAKWQGLLDALTWSDMRY
ncbi:related to gamma-tubulin complex component 5 [Sporisorium scitamineum]|uniref:Related to gamma-tubulin complex component 5 n=1 Tax=Sporisorium scitamineum TaxID=49012 RepID=A0A127Z3U0_9BASI|nr:related to gamma-tubulin complex component 5 [Sporisorium scitamineum]